MHIQEGLGIGKKILNCSHLFSHIKFLKDISIIEETYIQIFEEMIDSICLTFEGIVNKGGLGTNYTLEIVAEDMGDTSNNHEGYHHCYYANIDKSKQTPTSIDHFFTGEKIEDM